MGMQNYVHWWRDHLHDGHLKCQIHRRQGRRVKPTAPIISDVQPHTGDGWMRAELWSFKPLSYCIVAAPEKALKK